jgi:CTP:molybdopterin cytidylyltransferase MocA
MTAGAVVFAAGRGKRLRPLTDEVPKPAVPLLDLPLASFALTALRRAGLRTLVNVSHLPDIARSSLEPYAPDAIWFPEPEVPFGTAGTLREASRRGFLQGEVLVWNGDVVADVDPAALLREHHRRGAEATAVVEPCSQGADFLVEDGRAVAFVDRRRDPQAAGVRFPGKGGPPGGRRDRRHQGRRHARRLPLRHRAPARRTSGRSIAPGGDRRGRRRPRLPRAGRVGAGRFARSRRGPSARRQGGRRDSGRAGRRVARGGGPAGRDRRRLRLVPRRMRLPVALRAHGPLRKTQR